MSFLARKLRGAQPVTSLITWTPGITTADWTLIASGPQGPGWSLTASELQWTVTADGGDGIDTGSATRVVNSDEIETVGGGTYNIFMSGSYSIGGGSVPDSGAGGANLKVESSPQSDGGGTLTELALISFGVSGGAGSNSDQINGDFVVPANHQSFVITGACSGDGFDTFHQYLLNLSSMQIRYVP